MNLTHDTRPPPSAPTHHLPDAELLAHVAGHESDAALALGVACHLAMCARCRAEGRRLEALGGALLEAEIPVALADDALAVALARLDAAGQATPGDARRARSPSSPSSPSSPLPPELARLDLPLVLVDRLPAGGPRWRYVAPGVRGIDVPVDTDADTKGAVGTVRILRLKRGLVIPKHDHGAVEMTLIFAGGLTDAEGHFTRGDLSVRVPGQIHIQRIDAEEDCLALVVNGGKLVPQTWQGQLLRLIARP
jgi:putative transcriptional regulator